MLAIQASLIVIAVIVIIVGLMIFSGAGEETDETTFEGIGTKGNGRYKDARDTFTVDNSPQQFEAYR